MSFPKPDYSDDKVFTSFFCLKAYDLTIEEIARHLDVSHHTIRRWKQGKNLPLRIMRIKVIEAMDNYKRPKDL